jgi:predicted acylesterase/phospholipase RssA
LEDLLPSQLLEDTKIPISLVSSNLNTLELKLVEKGDAIKWVCASCAHPLFNRPIKHGKYHYADGGILNNVPSDACREKAGNNSLVITATCSCPFDHTPRSLKRADILLRVIYHALEKQRTDNASRFSDIIIDPFKDQNFDFKSWKTIFCFHNYKQLKKHYFAGRKAAEKKLPEILKLLK